MKHDNKNGIDHENRTRLPHYVFQALRWFCPDHLYEEIEGDLIQKFEKDARTLGEWRAKRRLAWNAMILISKEFILLVLVANVIAWPISYFVINDWLNGFAYRVSLGLLSFLIPGVLTLLIAVLTVATQSVKAANADPVKNLRTE